MLIDTHFHLDLMDNMQLLIKQSKNVNVGIMAVGTTPLAYKQELRFVNGANAIKVGLGLHPQLVKQRHQEIVHVEKEEQTISICLKRQNLSEKLDLISIKGMKTQKRCNLFVFIRLLGNVL